MTHVEIKPDNELLLQIGAYQLYLKKEYAETLAYQILTVIKENNPTLQKYIRLISEDHAAGLPPELRCFNPCNPDFTIATP